jgi:hypothetical protein
MKLSLSIVLVAVLAVPAFTGCAPTEESDVSSESSDVEEGPENGGCQWSGEANDLYRAAVRAASEQIRSDDACTDGAGDPRALAQEAVDRCGAVGTLIAESEYAGDLRQVLGFLEVAYLAGDLADGEDGFVDSYNPTAVAEALIGQSLWTQKHGGGDASEVYFLDYDSRYTVRTYVWSEEVQMHNEEVIEGGTWHVSQTDDGTILFSTESDSDSDGETYGAIWKMERAETVTVDSFIMAPIDGEGGNLYTFDIDACGS